ncbi:hypothetical protein pneo_cds_585 [Pandoravirus neocaledonia]|uniref:Uncharacterized protein n=1 Tax=Pandoravirus neocaledonia TaxID=2107708 RepID=A0A2U7UCS2_9VIRU|nr:hypothetical protein pneo_cds_585 [Pandoravirus neocaledonia]AVK76192.1 hypothetical protein pneo_cds_585 [Pandoravirus neocaledonia]
MQRPVATALPRLVYDDDDINRPPTGGGCGDYNACFEALVGAIARDDAAGVRRALAGGIDPSQPFGQSQAAFALRAQTGEPVYVFNTRHGLGAVPYTTNANGPWPISPENMPRAVARLTRPMSTTPLGLAAAHGSTAAAEALIEAGAVPWPTPEAVINEALATMNVTGFRRGGDRYAPIAPYDPVALVSLLLTTFARSPALSAWDVNPLLVVVRGLAGDAALAARGARPLVGPLLSSMLVDAGYSPDERALAVVLDDDDGGGDAFSFVRKTPEERARIAARDVGAHVLQDISALEDNYPDLGNPEAQEEEEQEALQDNLGVPQDARIHHDALWTLADQYGLVGPHTAQEIDNFVEMRVLPW